MFRGVCRQTEPIARSMARKIWNSFPTRFAARMNRSNIESGGVPPRNLISSLPTRNSASYPILYLRLRVVYENKEKKETLRITILPLTEKIIFEPFLLSPPDYREISSPRRKTKRRKMRREWRNVFPRQEHRSNHMLLQDDGMFTFTLKTR